jgi:transcriptional regulator with XRE-family HTH domain
MMIVIQEDGNYFGETRVLGIGNAKPELKYGKVAKKLREDANITVEELSKEFSIKAKLIEEMEAQTKGMTEEIMAKYCEKFNVKKEDFFDTNTARLILGEGGVVLKTFDTAEECKKEFNKIMLGYIANRDLFIDFSENALQEAEKGGE